VDNCNLHSFAFLLTGGHLILELTEVVCSVWFWLLGGIPISLYRIWLEWGQVVDRVLQRKLHKQFCSLVQQKCKVRMLSDSENLLPTFTFSFYIFTLDVHNWTFWPLIWTDQHQGLSCEAFIFAQKYICKHKTNCGLTVNKMAKMVTFTSKMPTSLSM